MVNVKDYGAIGDGLVNDSTAFTNTVAALSAFGGTIQIPPGHYRVDNFTLNKDNIHVVGEGWGSIIQPYTAGADTIRIDLTPGATITPTTRRDIVIKDLYLKGRSTGSSGNGITNKHPGSLFAAGSDNNLDYTKIEHCMFTDYALDKNCIDLRNVDNRLLITHNRFQTVLGKDIYVEANGRAGGNITIGENGMTHGAPRGCIELHSIKTNIKRTNIVNNTMVISQGNNAIPGILLQNDGGIVEHVNIWGNSIEDAKFGIDIGGNGTGQVRDVKIKDNWFFHRTTPPESGQRCVILRANSRGCLVSSNYYEGTGYSNTVAIENLNTANAPINRITETAENFVNCRMNP